MNTVSRYLAERPGYGFGSQFCPVTEEIQTTICFSNYYDRVFRDAKVIVDLDLVFFDAEGNEVGHLNREIEPGGAVQVDASEIGGARTGMVAVAAVPRADLAELNRAGLNLKSPITTGFYVTWSGANGGRDIMHEWAGVRSSAIPTVTHHIGVGPSRAALRHGVVLMNPVVESGQSANVRIGVRKSSIGGVLAQTQLAAIPSMGTRVVEFDACFPGFSEWLRTEGPLIVDITSDNLSPPLTLENHPSGDFHIHHL